MKRSLNSRSDQALAIAGVLSLTWFSWFPTAYANPQGGTVTQGRATFTTQGSQFTIHTSDRAAINWQSFNIGVGQTTTFVQPSSSSVVWNQINDANPSQILGNLNANGYVVLQNRSGFYIGGQATITAHGLVMTTAPIPVPDLASGGSWQFNALPPTASIVNYGQINLSKGGSVFLIAHDVQNHGTISAPEGNVGLYAGKQVLVSDRADGRALSAQVTLPEGSVDNSGNITADAGTIAMHAAVVNQGGLIQANSIRQRNGIIELVASDAVNLGANSVIEAKGGSQGISSGGSVLVKSENAFTDESTSAINISGAVGGGNGGQLEISARWMSSIHSAIDGSAARGFKAGRFLIDPLNIILSNLGDPAPPSGTVNPGDPPTAGTLTLDVRSFNNLISQNKLSQISLQAVNDITLNTRWTLPASDDPSATLSLQAGRNITLANGSAIDAGMNWNISLLAGTELTSAAGRVTGRDGIYLNGNSFIQTLNGNIHLRAANELFINPGTPFARNTGDPGNNGIRTLKKGNIDVWTDYGDVNTGGNFTGFSFGQNAFPYYKVSQNLGGISTAVEGNVTINAGGNIASYLPTQNNYNNGQYDGGSGAFGSGNVTITSRGGSISGHYVVANGTGTVSAERGDVGSPTANGGFALSLIKGSWSVSAPVGSIYVQDIRNPNGVFNDKGYGSYKGYHYFDYDPLASVSLKAGNAVEITGAGAPHGVYSSGTPVPLLFPPSLEVIAGSGGFTLDTDVILFPSPFANLQVKTTGGGNFQSYQDPNDPLNVIMHTLDMSDSAAKQWDPTPSTGSFGSFLNNDHALVPPGLSNPDLKPVEITVSGSMNNVNLRTTKETHVTVDKNMVNSGVLGQNLHPSDKTYINVAGKISYPPIYSFTGLEHGIVGVDPRNPSAWDAIFSLLVDPTRILSKQLAGNETPAELLALAEGFKLLLGSSSGTTFDYEPGANPGFIYDAASKQLGFRFRMADNIRSALEGTLRIIKLDALGNPVIQLGQANLGQDPTKYYFATTTVDFAPKGKIEDLYLQSLKSLRDDSQLSPGFQIGGPGQFNINAGSIDLGSSKGIISWGIGSAMNPVDYSPLAGVTHSGAEVNVNVAGNLSMLTSTIASIYGGNVNINCGGGLALSLGNFALIPPSSGAICFGIFTSGHSDINVIANNDINVGGARIATFNGGNVLVRSLGGNVNAGNGANSTLVVPVIYRDPKTGFLITSAITEPRPYGSGILAMSPTAAYQTPGGGGLPGNITVETPHGDILSTLGGIQQIALNGSIAGGPTITLTAGTPPSAGSPGYAGNVRLGAGGVVGGTVNITAQGDIQGLIVSHQNSTINAAQSFNGTLLAGGSANVAAGGTVSGTVIGISGVNASGGGGITASLLGQNVSVGGAQAQSTLGTTAAATSTSQAAAQTASSDAKEQVTKDTAQDDDQKKNAKRPVLTRKIGRVTVILPKV